MIRICDLHKTIGTQKILCGIDLEVAEGESVVIVGRSGGGKSVLLKHIIGLLNPDEGTILFRGKPFQSGTMFEYRIGESSNSWQTRGRKQFHF